MIDQEATRPLASLTQERLRRLLAGVAAGILIIALLAYATCSRQHRQFSLQRLQNVESESAAREVLDSLGCSPSLTVTLTRRWQTPMFAFLAIVAIGVAISVGPLLQKRNLKIDLGNLLLAAGLLVAAWQWQAQVEQKAMDQYAGDVAALNTAEANDPNDGIHTMMSHLYPKHGGDVSENNAKVHYVYVQLDNLEYALERYVEGLASPETTVRAVNTFESRCASAEFRGRVGEQLSASYPPIVRRVATRLSCNHP